MHTHSATICHAPTSLGPIVRVSPNELSIASVESWRTIHGHAAPGKGVMPKSPFYDIYGSGFRRLCIGSERDPKKHGGMRRMLSAAFSQRALLEREIIVAGIIDKCVEIVGESGGKATKGLNMTKWYEMMMVVWGFAHSLFMLKNSEFSRRQVERRLDSHNPRKDFVTLLVQNVRDGEMVKEEMTAHVSTLAIAGGETVPTFLAGTTFFLLKKPSTMRFLTDEIRKAFPLYEAINAQKAQQLPYLQAVINEGLRIYPPGSQGFPRVSTGFELHSRYIPPGAEVYTSAWAITHDPKYWKDPMEFIPERWLESGSQDIKEASQPFSLGPGGCLGRNRFAYMEMNLLLAKMLWKYDLELVNNDVDWLSEGKVHVMWWKPELIVRFHPRHYI